MKKMKYIFITLISASMLLASCDRVLKQNPQGTLDAGTALTDRAGVEAALVGAYSLVQSGNYHGLRYWAFADLYADNIAHTGTFPSFAQFQNKQILADNVEISNMWNSIYNGINRTNNIIFFTPQVNDGALNKNQVLSEARTLRAMFYFDLIRYFGGSENGFNQGNGLGVPLFTDPTLTPADADPKARSTEAQIFTQILADLDFAIANLATPKVRGRINRATAQAIKARVQLYRGNFDDAEALATAVITTPGLALVSTANYESIWLSQNTAEAIWELNFDPVNSNAIAFFYYPTALGGRNEIKASVALANAHEVGDIRLPVNSVSTPANLARTTRKFTRVNGTDNVVMLRLAEMYLIRAEARARKAAPDFVGSLSDINTIRQRAGLAPSAAASQTDLINAVIQERRVELAHEGHRFFDARRLNFLPAVGITQTFRARLPIPQREVQTSGNVVAQNPGY